MKMEKDVRKLMSLECPERVIGEKKKRYKNQYYPDQKFLATLVIGIRLNEDEPWRLKNLKAILDWLHFYYSDIFEVLIVEQDSEQKLDTSTIVVNENIRYEFLFNPYDYNRGWGYNVAVKHFCQSSKTVCLLDTDVVPGANFLSDVRDCHSGLYDVVSPYQNIYYTDESEAEKLIDSKQLNHLTDSSKIKNPVTITGGILIIGRNLYMNLCGFEQYIGYGCEDRAFDVTILNKVEPKKIKISPFAYAHLWHPTDRRARKNWEGIYNHLQNNYQCKWSKELGPFEFIHEKCEHVDSNKIISNISEKLISFGDIELYKHGLENLSYNGVLKKPDVKRDVIFPEKFCGFDYIKNETYSAPKPDSNELASLHNKFWGKRCFIIGNGPSLNKHDLKLLENEYSFGVNSFYYKTRETGFRPTFYVVEDSSVMKENIEEIRNFYAPFKFFPTIYKNLHPKEPNTFFFTMNRGFYEKSSLNYCIPRFSPDATKELYCGQSVTFINLQLAYFLGFTEVYLIGMDFDYVIPKSHKRNGDVLLSDSDDPNHFHKDYFGKGKTWKDPKLDRVKANYEIAKLAYESVGRKIFNATVGGKLEVFERIDYYSLLKGDESNNEQSTQPDTFEMGNKFFSQKRYVEALRTYLNLMDKLPEFAPYKRAAVLAFVAAQERKINIPDELKARINSLMNG